MKNILKEKTSLYRNSILSLSYQLISMVVSFFSAPLLLKCLGTERYGAWVTLLSLISWIYYFDLGIGRGLQNKLAESYARNDVKSSKIFLSTAYITIFTIISFVSLVIIVILYFIDCNKLFNIHIENENINLVLIFALLFASINFVASLANNVLAAIQRASLVGFWNLTGQIFFVLALLIYLRTGTKSLLMMAVMQGSCQLLKNILETSGVFIKEKSLRFRVQDFNIKYSKDIFSFGVKILIMNIAALVLNSTDNIIITRFFTPADVTPYSFCYNFFGMINSIFIAIISPVLSGYTAALVRKDKPWILKTLKKCWTVYALIVLGTIIAIFVFKPFSRLWLHKELDYQTGLILLVAVYYIILMSCHILSSFVTGIGEIKETTAANIIQAIVNIPVSIFCAVNLGMGVNGVILGSVVSVVIGFSIGMWKLLSILRRLDNKIQEFDVDGK